MHFVMQKKELFCNILNCLYESFSKINNLSYMSSKLWNLGNYGPPPPQTVQGSWGSTQIGLEMIVMTKKNSFKQILDCTVVEIETSQF